MTHPFIMPIQLLKQPMGIQTSLQNNLEGDPLNFLHTPQNQSPVSIPYKLAIWIYVVRPFQTPCILFIVLYFVDTHSHFIIHTHTHTATHNLHTLIKTFYLHTSE